MRRRVAFTSMSTALLLLLSAGAVLGQDIPPGPTTRHRVTFEVTNPFFSVWGDQAPARWVQERNAALAALRP